MCQGEFAESNTLQEREGQGQKNICYNHLNTYYHIKQMMGDNDKIPQVRKESSLPLSLQLDNKHISHPPTNFPPVLITAKGFMDE